MGCSSGQTCILFKVESHIGHNCAALHSTFLVSHPAVCHLTHYFHDFQYQARKQHYVVVLFSIALSCRVPLVLPT